MLNIQRHFGGAWLWPTINRATKVSGGTFVEPVCQAVEDHALSAGGSHPQGTNGCIWLVVDVVFKDVDLKRKGKNIMMIMMSKDTLHIIYGR